MNDVSKSMGPMEWLLLIGLSVLWGGSFFFGKVAVAEIPPLTLVLGRVCLAAAALNVIVALTGNRMPHSPRPWVAFLVMGALNNLIPFSLIFWGQTRIPSGLASILNSTTPLFTVVLAHYLTQDERMTPSKLAGIGFGVAGVAVMMGPDAIHGLGTNLLAQAAVLGAALSYGLAGIFGRGFRGVPPLVTATGQVTATSVMVLPIALLSDRPWTLAMPGPRSLAAVACLALFCTALAYVIYFRILAVAGATNLLLVTFLIPVSALVLGMSILGERLQPGHFSGMALIALGLAAIDGRTTRMIKGRIDLRRASGAEASRHYRI